jgi:hypothetical protein
MAKINGRLGRAVAVIGENFSTRQGHGIRVIFTLRPVLSLPWLPLCDIAMGTVLPASTDNCAKMRSPVNRILQISPL